MKDLLNESQLPPSTVPELEELTAEVNEVKKIYPICVNFHQSSKVLAISLIDCDNKIYQLKQ